MDKARIIRLVPLHDCKVQLATDIDPDDPDRPIAYGTIAMCTCGRQFKYTRTISKGSVMAQSVACWAPLNHTEYLPKSEWDPS